MCRVHGQGKARACTFLRPPEFLCSIVLCSCLGERVFVPLALHLLHSLSAGSRPGQTQGSCRRLNLDAQG